MTDQRSIWIIGAPAPITWDDYVLLEACNKELVAKALERAALEGATEQLEWAISVVPSETEHYLHDNLIILRARLAELDKEAKEK